MKTNILPTEKQRRVDLLDLPEQMTDPSYVDALALTVKAALDYRAPAERVTIADAREIVLVCLADGLFTPQGWGSRLGKGKQNG